MTAKNIKLLVLIIVVAVILPSLFKIAMNIGLLVICLVIGYLVWVVNNKFKQPKE